MPAGRSGANRYNSGSQARPVSGPFTSQGVHELGIREAITGALSGSLLTRLVLSLLIVGVVPLTVVALVLYDVNRNAIELATEQKHAVAAETAAARIDEFLRTRGSLVDAAAASPALADDPAGPTATASLTALLRSLNDLDAVLIRTEAGAEVVRVQRPGAAAALDQLIQRPLREGVAVERIPGGVWFLFTAPIDGTDGLITIVSDGSPLTEVVETEVRTDGAALAVLSSDLEPVLEGRNPLRTGEAQLAQLMEDLRDASRNRLSSRGTLESKEVLAAWAGLQQAPWLVISEEPIATAQEVSRGLVRAALEGVGLALVLVALLSTATYVSVVKPIRQLIQARGAAVGPGGEIRALEQAFEDLERRVRDRASLDKTFLGRYQVLQVLGGGAMGMVFTAWDPQLERRVAIKTLRLDRTPDREDRSNQVDRLLREAVTTARFSHPNIVSIYDVVDADQLAFIVMELVQGKALDRHLFQDGRLSEAETVEIGLAIAKALQAAHSRGIVHQDIKPANVLMGDDGAIKVTDFGIARLVETLQAKEDEIFGTPGYLPPEAVYRGEFDERGDLFALGVVLYQCLTGRSPFLGAGIRDTVRKTIQCSPPALAESGVVVSARLDALIMEQLLAKERATRPRTAEPVVATLNDLAKSVRKAGSTAAKQQPDRPTEPMETERILVSPSTQMVSTSRLGDHGLAR